MESTPDQAAILLLMTVLLAATFGLIDGFKVAAPVIAGMASCGWVAMRGMCVS